MEAPQILISTITPISGKKISAFDKHSKYIVKITTPGNLAEALHRYSEDFFEAAHLITEFILDMQYSDIGKFGGFAVKRIFNEQTHIDLVKFANKYEAAYEIIRRFF